MDTETSGLSSLAKSLWGKLSHEGFHSWLPLWVHLCDTGEVTKLLWDHWLPEHTKRIIANGISDVAVQEGDRLFYARKIAVFMAVAHDIGKVSPVFQEKAAKVGFGDVVDEITSRGLVFSSSANEVQKRDFTHAIITQRILELQGMDRSYAVVIGGHHGKPPNDGRNVDRVTSFSNITGVGKSGWDNVQKEFVQFALDKAGLIHLPEGSFAITAQVILTGVLIVADWIASGEGFPLGSRDYSYRVIGSSEQRAYKAWNQLKLPEYGKFSDDLPYSSLFSIRFGIDTPRPMQTTSLQTALQAEQPGLFVIEAPMGEGKTEAALATAEVLACKYKMSGVYFALPTQATSDGIFKRIGSWIGKLHSQERRSIFLAHGKSGFNKEYAGIKLHSNICNYEESYQGEEGYREAVIVNDWTQGRKKGLLSDFVVGTIDQILLCGLKQKHLALRHLGVANKVVIIDECHAYDTYMSSYLDLVLSWLGAYQVPVIVLSATLPPHRRKELLKAYGEAWPHKKKKKKMLDILENKTKNMEKAIAEIPKEISEYPLISYTDGCDIKAIVPPGSGRKLSVKMEAIGETKLVEILQSLLAEGGCSGIIRNTVKKAQETAQILEACFGAEHVRLLHSRFISRDRVCKEDEVRCLLGPVEEKRPKKLIVVGTQVMEQSLDVDFDVLFTDVCPMDLLLQRMGRLHRHSRHQPRPFRLREATCFILGMENEIEFDKGSTAVYGAYLLLKTKAFLKNTIQMPGDIPQLVQQSYEEGYDAEMVMRLSNGCDRNVIQAACTQAKKEYDRIISDKKSKSETFQIMTPNAKGKDLLGWLKADLKDKSGKRGEATVRDTDSSLEVLVVRKKEDGYIYTLPWLPEYADTRIDGVPDDKLAKVIAGCSVSLPSFFTAAWNIDRVIAALENVALEHHLDDWYESYWLEGELFIVLNEDYGMPLLDKIVIYDKKYGLSVKQQEV